MQRGERDSTQDWLVPEEPDGEISVERAEPDTSPEPDTAIFDSVGRQPDSRHEAVAEIDAETSRAAMAAAVSAERAAAAALAVEERYGRDFDRLHRSSAQAAEHARAAAETAKALSERVDRELAAFGSRVGPAPTHAPAPAAEPASVPEDAPPEDALAAFSDRADRIVAALQALESDATRVSVSHENGAEPGS